MTSEEITTNIARLATIAEHTLDNMNAMERGFVQHSARLAKNDEQFAKCGELIAKNSELIAKNSELIARNDEQIARNSELIASVSRGIESLLEISARHETRITRIGDLEDNN